MGTLNNIQKRIQQSKINRLKQKVMQEERSSMFDPKLKIILMRMEQAKQSKINRLKQKIMQEERSSMFDPKLNKLQWLLSKFQNGKERYDVDPFFRSIIYSIMEIENIEIYDGFYKLIDSLIVDHKQNIVK